MSDPAPLSSFLDPTLHAHHAAHPDGPCFSMQCLRQHCNNIAANVAAAPSADPTPAPAAAAASSSAVVAPTSPEWCDSTSPFEGSPRSTRSGTSPGYANDWSLRPERLDRLTDKPSRDRRDREVRRLASAKLGEAAAAPSQDANAAPIAAVAAPSPAVFSRPMPPATSSASASVATPLLQSVGGASKLLQRRQQRKQSDADAAQS